MAWACFQLLINVDVLACARTINVLTCLHTSLKVFTDNHSLKTGQTSRNFAFCHLLILSNITVLNIVFQIDLRFNNVA